MNPELNDWVWAASRPMSTHSVPGAALAVMAMARVAKRIGWPRTIQVKGDLMRERSVLRSANRLSEVPACSNRVKKTMDPPMSTNARNSRSRSTFEHFVTMNRPT